MEDYSSAVPELEGEEKLIAAAQQLVKALGSKKNLTGDAIKVLADLGSQLTAMATICESQSEEESSSSNEGQFDAIQKKIVSWELDRSMIWDSGHDEMLQYLNAVDEARRLIERLESQGPNKDDEQKELLQKAYSILQTAMERIEEEFKYILVQNRQPYEPEHMSFRSSEEDATDVGSILSLGDDSVDDSLHRDSVSRTVEEFIVDLVNRSVLSDLKSIVNLMFGSKYGHECSNAYITVRRDALDECFFILEVEKLSIEDVLKLEWGSLHSKMKRWVRAMKVFVRVYLASEKWLAEHIFGGHGEADLICFTEASKAFMLQLLNFGEAISIGPHKPEKLSAMLEMYEVLADLLLDIDSLFLEEAGSHVRNYSREVLRRLGDSVKAAFLEFENAIATSSSTNAFAGGGIHHLTRYVMNYLNMLTDYQETLNFLLKDHVGEDPVSCSSPEMSPSLEEENTDGNLCDVSPMALHFRSVASILECNLDEKAKLYRDVSLQHIFLMNNIHYMARKVKNSELRLVFGDDWIRKRNWKFQQHAMNYERATWSPVLSLLKEEGYSNSISKILLERCRNFYLAFEEVYRTQTAWVIPDDQLREDLRISMSLKVIQAYRTFVGRYANQIGDKYIKYSAEDLQNFLLDLFEGSPRSLHNPHKR